MNIEKTFIDIESQLFDKVSHDTKQGIVKWSILGTSYYIGTSCYTESCDNYYVIIWIRSEYPNRCTFETQDDDLGPRMVSLDQEAIKQLMDVVDKYIRSN